MKYPWGHSKRYNDYGNFTRRLFNGRVQKVSVNAGLTCPNRDGSKGFGGCTFCNNESFKPSYCQSHITVREQIQTGIARFRQRHPGAKFLAYFQAYTNTYGELSRLIDLYDEAISAPGITGLVIGTRPDCLPGNLLDYLQSLRKRLFLAVELGVESTKDTTLVAINRGHDFTASSDAILALHERDIPVGVHIILGLPGEERDDFLRHAGIISTLPVNFIKIHQMQYVRGSVLGEAYTRAINDFNVFKLDEYVEIIVDFLELLHPGIVVERFASQAPDHLLIAPRWGLKSFEIGRLVEERLLERDSWQGKRFS